MAKPCFSPTSPKSVRKSLPPARRNSPRGVERRAAVPSPRDSRSPPLSAVRLNRLRLLRVRLQIGRWGRVAEPTPMFPRSRVIAGRVEKVMPIAHRSSSLYRRSFQTLSSRQSSPRLSLSTVHWPKFPSSRTTRARCLTGQNQQHPRTLRSPRARGGNGQELVAISIRSLRSPC